MPPSVSSGSTKSFASHYSSRNGCGCSEQAAAAWIIIPIITIVAVVLALTLSQQEPFSKSARDQRESNYYDGYANKEDVAVIDTTAHNVTMHSAIITDDGMIANNNTTWNGTTPAAAAAVTVVVRKVAALSHLD